MNSNSTVDFDAASAFVGREHQLLIEGEWVSAASGRSFPVFNPADGTELARAAFGEKDDVDLAVQAARRALAGPWSDLPHTERAELLLALLGLIERDAEILAIIEALDNGKPVSDARRIDIPGTLAELRECAGWANKLFGEAIRFPDGNGHAFTVREPVGVTGMITPWNYPLMVAVNKVAPALAAGCTVVLKPAEQAPLSSLYLGELMLEAGVPKGVINIVTGDGTTGAALAAHDGVDKISFTGSTEVGKKIVSAAAGNLKRLMLELGGKSPIVIFPDADIDSAIDAAAEGIFLTSGQVCGANSRLYAHRDVFDRVVSGIAEKARALKIGPGLDEDTQMGPLVSAKQLDRVAGLIGSAVSEGAEAVTGGNRIDQPGFFIEPTVLVGAEPNTRIMREEVFGPVLASASFDDDDLDRIAAEANNTAYGLAAYVWTRDLGIAHKMASKLRVGCVSVNGGWAAELPFGGVKQSGWGRESGRAGIEAYLELKSVGIAY